MFHFWHFCAHLSILAGSALFFGIVTDTSHMPEWGLNMLLLSVTQKPNDGYGVATRAHSP